MIGWLNRPRKIWRRRKGYTLLEMIIVVAIIGLLATLVGPQLFNRLDQSRVTTAQTQIKMLRSALDAYRLDVGDYPNEAEGLSTLVNAPVGDAASGWRGPYIDGGVLPADPWGRPYLYAPDNGNGVPAIYSFGADGRPGGAGLNATIGTVPKSAASEEK